MKLQIHGGWLGLVIISGAPMQKKSRLGIVVSATFEFTVPASALLLPADRAALVEFPARIPRPDQGSSHER